MDVSSSPPITSIASSIKPADTQKTNSPTELNQQEKQVVVKLQARDRAVRAHEQAHVTAGGSLVISGPSYTYQKGPDGINYAVGGEVNIDTSKEADPEATIQKSQQIRRAALAPADPSAQDRAVAAQATQLATEARAELQQEKIESNNSSESSPFSNDRRSSGELVDITV
jgi:hypothetical protein